MTPPRAFLDLAAANDIAFEPGDLERLSRYLEVLLEMNTRFNLTSITDPDEAWVRHIFDSLTLLPYLQALDQPSVIDVGAGGGLPGIPLAIVYPPARFTLLEATGKKAKFLENTASDLELANVTVVNDRAETAGQDYRRHREQYDLVMARAVGPLPVLLELTVPFALVGGLVLAIKGERAASEIAAAKPALHLLHAAVSDTRRTSTGTIIVIEKLRKTPRLYPRPPGEPKRKPLGVKR